MDEETGEYPYGRNSLRELRAHDDTLAVKQVMQNNDLGKDDDAFYMERDNDQLFVLYEAPRPDDKGRGHLSIWFEVGDGMWKNVYTMTGDDGTIHDQFMNIHQGGGLPELDEERIERLRTDN